MKLREFNRHIKELCSPEGKGKAKRLFIDLEKVKAAPDDLKEQLVRFLVRNHRADIIKEMIPSNFDWSWFHCMGYGYSYSTDRYTFLCTSESRGYWAAQQEKNHG